MSHRVILLAFLITLSSISAKNITIHNLNDNNFESHVNEASVDPWLLIFYLKSCPHCKSAKEAMAKMSEGEDFEKLNVSLGDIDCNVNIMTCMRFNITRVPYIVYTENNKIFEFETLPTEHSLLKFIKDEKTLENSKHLPPPFTYLSLVFKLLGDTVIIVNDYISNYVNKKLGYDFEWNTNFTIVVFIVAFALLIMLEYLFLSCCCTKKKNHKNKDKTATHVKKD
jgi:glutaredoxin